MPVTVTGGAEVSTWRPSAPDPTIVWHRCLPEAASHTESRPLVYSTASRLRDGAVPEAEERGTVARHATWGGCEVPRRPLTHCRTVLDSLSGLGRAESRSASGMMTSGVSVLWHARHRLRSQIAMAVTGPAELWLWELTTNLHTCGCHWSTAAMQVVLQDWIAASGFRLVKSV